MNLREPSGDRAFSGGDWGAELGRPARYLGILERLRDRHGAEGQRLYRVTQDGVPLHSFVQEGARVARMVAAAVRDGSYEPSPARMIRVMLDKPRDLVSLAAADVLLHGVVGQLLAEVIEPGLSSSLYSYRRGRSNWQAVRALAAFVRTHRRAEPDVRRRGLYVLRCDVRSYGDSIPLDAMSPLWSDLSALPGAPSPGSPAWQLIERLLRVELADSLADGSQNRRSRIVGLPTGSPLVPPVENLYLSGLDVALTGVPGGFYARFGDDIVFVHRDPARVMAAEETVRQHLSARRLSLNEAKLRRCFFNGAGRSPEDARFAGSTQVVFLGARIGFDGTVALDGRKVSVTLAGLRARIRRARALLAGDEPGERARVLCRIVAQSLDPTSIHAMPHASLLRFVVTDRRQLAQLDYEVARTVAQALTGCSGPRAFRQFGYGLLRRTYGLPSLVFLRNQV